MNNSTSEGQLTNMQDRTLEKSQSPEKSSSGGINANPPTPSSMVDAYRELVNNLLEKVSLAGYWNILLIKVKEPEKSIWLESRALQVSILAEISNLNVYINFCNIRFWKDNDGIHHKQTDQWSISWNFRDGSNGWVLWSPRFHLIKSASTFTRLSSINWRFLRVLLQVY